MSMPAVIFPDVEKVLVAAIKSELSARIEPYAQNVMVATKKPAPDVKPYPARIVTVRGDGGPELDHVRKLERVGVTIYANTYSNASDLSRLLEALFRTMTGEQIKMVSVILSPVRLDEGSTEEARFMTLEVITKASSL
jgi:hypothetical protein